MAGYQPYPEYKESGVEWLGMIPQSWERTRVKFIGNIILGLTYSPADTVSEGGTLVLRSSNVQDGKIVLDDCVYVSCDVPKKLTTRTNDILICSRNGSRALIGKCALIDERSSGETFGAFMTVLRTEYAKFLYYVLSSTIFTFQSGRYLTSTINQLTVETLGGFEFVMPPHEEQQTIARFLDHKTAQIDALIAKKQTLLEKLAEKRTALISHAVTKGLDPNVKMKDSGVEWLGQVPAHWSVSKLSLIATSLQTGPFGSQLHAGDYIEGGTPLINPADIVNGKLVANPKNTVSEDVVERLSRHVLELGDIVIARRGEMGRAGVVTDKNVGWLCGTGSLRARIVQNKIISHYLLMQFSLHGLADYLSLQSVGSTMDNLNTSILGRLPVLLPPMGEQKEILLALAETERAISMQAEKVGDAIEKLKEYRSALITQAVTGKIDVRNVKISDAITKGQAA